ncbi:hypothetical protein EGR_01106 [Echinococcus granulosus]|uniref:Uncharacterized protein n=1 Tax=Echinococcus granulosus TaxID=6210 RepID=W6URX3_ECHGR|nr:hypothetical protein EGR_01106 [Echinococcus granulosus]EUB63978.1 hypothetical protein EGR_01106 [Echinococcus granulosus]
MVDSFSSTAFPLPEGMHDTVQFELDKLDATSAELDKKISEIQHLIKSAKLDQLESEIRVALKLLLKGDGKSTNV